MTRGRPPFYKMSGSGNDFVFRRRPGRATARDLTEVVADLICASAARA